MNSVAVDHAEIGLTSEEVILLKELAAKPLRRWWRDYPLVVSVLAFSLSLITSAISAYVAHSRDIHDEESQLAATLTTIQDLNLQQIELHEKYKGTPYEAQASGLVANEYNSVLHRAAHLAVALGSRASTADLTGIAQGVYGLGEYQLSLELLKSALAGAETANDESIALRDLGFYMLRNDRSSDATKLGEEYFERALNLDHEWNLSDQPLVVAWLRSSAQLGWAAALASSDCTSAQEHFAEAVKILLGAPDTIDFDQARAGAQQQWKSGIGGIPDCLPDASTPTLP